jgi:hypothetical protein
MMFVVKIVKINGCQNIPTHFPIIEFHELRVHKNHTSEFTQDLQIALQLQTDLNLRAQSMVTTYNSKPILIAQVGMLD